MIIVTGVSGGIGSVISNDLSMTDSIVGLYNTNKPTNKNKGILYEQIDLQDENQIIELYKQILKREPDKTGLYYFTSKLKTKELTIFQVSKILMESEEGKAFTNFSHYTDTYWNSLDVIVKYKNKLATDNEHVQ